MSTTKLVNPPKTLQSQLEDSILVLNRIKEIYKKSGGKKSDPNIAFALYNVKKKILAGKESEITNRKIKQWCDAKLGGSNKKGMKY